MQWIKTLCLFTFFGWQTHALANSHAYFVTDWGEQVRVENTGDNNNPKYLIYATSQGDMQLLFKQFVKASLERRHYVYELGENCNPVCQHGTGTPAKKSFFTGLGDWVNKVVEGAASALGSRTVDEVADKLTKDTTVTNSKFQIVLGQNKKPVLICHQTEAACEPLPNVNIINLDGGGWAVEYPNYVPGHPQYSLRRGVEDLVDRFIRYTGGLQCRVVYTDSGNGPVAQMVCYPSH